MAPFWKGIINKINPLQPDIASSEAGAGYPNTNTTAAGAPNTVGIVKRCIELITDSANEIPLKLYTANNTGEVVEAPNKRLATFLTAPNEQYDRIRFYSNLVSDLIIDGNAFIYFSKDGFYHLPAEYVEIIEDSQNFISGFRYIVNGSMKEYPRANIIHVRLNNNQSVYRGVGKLAPIENELKIYKAMLDYQESFFTNSGLPRVILKTMNFLNRKTKSRLLEDWKAAHRALHNKAQGTAILDGGLDIDVLENSFKDLDFNMGIERLEKYIAVILGVPWVLLSSGNNANIRNNERLFYYHTIIPIMNRIAAAIEHHVNKILLTRTKLLIKPDIFGVSALRPDMKEHASYLATLVNGGILTPNEARVELRKENIEGLDEIRVPVNVAGSAADPTQGGKPSAE